MAEESKTEENSSASKSELSDLLAIKNAKWYKDQTIEWDKLINSGWCFFGPSTINRNSLVVLFMSRQNIEIKISLFYDDLRSAHTQMLNTCKAIAGSLNS